jgi:AcrR family transcriptional regulator
MKVYVSKNLRGRLLPSMARPNGSRAQDYNHKRTELLKSVEKLLFAQPGVTPSLRAMAEAAKVSIPTLKHYFGSREGVLAAWIEVYGEAGSKYRESISRTKGSFELSVRNLIAEMELGFVHFGVIDGLAAGMANGMGSAELGRTFIAKVFEPSLASIELRLEQHLANGEMRQCDTRIAALTLFSTLFVAAMHQQVLAGATVRPLDWKILVDEVARAFVIGYRAQGT